LNTERENYGITSDTYRKNKGIAFISLLMASVLLLNLCGCGTADVPGKENGEDVFPEMESGHDETVFSEADSGSEKQKDIPENAVQIPIEYRTEDPESMRTEVRLLTEEEITGFADGQYPAAKPIEVNGNTVLCLRQKPATLRHGQKDPAITEKFRRERFTALMK